MTHRLSVSAIAVPVVALLAILPAVGTAGLARAQSHDPGSAARAPVAGQNISDAGVLTSTARGNGTIVAGSDDWWVVYPGRVGEAVVVSIADNAPDSPDCPIHANLDGTDGTDQALTQVNIDSGTSQTLAGTAAGSDRYYVEVDTDGCQDGPYTISLTSGGGGTPPDPAAGSVPAGTSIANAWPPLRGHVSYAARLANEATTDWYVLFKKTDTANGTIRLEDLASGFDCPLHFVLYDSDGTDGTSQVVNVDNNGAATFTVPGKAAQDPQGEYFLAVSADGCAPGAPYSAEPEPAAQWSSPARIPGGHVAAAGTARSAWPPLHGHVGYGAKLGGVRTTDWFLLYKNPGASLATVRLQNTASGCTLNFALYGAGATGTAGRLEQFARVDGDAAVVFTVAGREGSDPQGRYFVAVSGDGCELAGEPYSIEPEPAAQWRTPALKVATTTLARGIVHKRYSAAIAVSEGTRPYSFTAKTALPLGLRLAKATGLITGTPAKAGSYGFTVLITDSARPHHRSVTVRFSLTIAR